MELVKTGTSAVSIIDSIDQAEEGLLGTGENSMPCFHDHRWAAILNKSYGFKLFYLQLLRNGVRTGMLPLMEASYPFGFHKRGVSLPFTDFCEPLAADKKCFEELFQAAVKLGKSRGWHYIELRGGADWLPRESCGKSFFGHLLNIDKDDKGLLSGMKDATRRNIRNAQRQNIRYSSERTWEAMQAFYRLHCRTRKKHGVPPQPIRFFRLLHQHVVAKGNGFIALARHNDLIIAAAVFLLYGNRALYKFGASDERYLKTRANDLVMWEAFKTCRGLGVQQLYFGRTEPDNLGLRRFKTGFGAQEYPLSYFRFDLISMKFCPQKPAKEVSSRPLFPMPSFMLRLAGEMAYPFAG